MIERWRMDESPRFEKAETDRLSAHGLASPSGRRPTAGTSPGQIAGPLDDTLRIGCRDAADHPRWRSRDRDGSIIRDESDTAIGRAVGMTARRLVDHGAGSKECDGRSAGTSSSRLLAGVQRVAGGGPLPTGGK